MDRYRKFAKLFSIIGLLLIVTGVTYSFFNYTRTGVANSISVGRVSFVTRQTETINLTNVFPIDRANIDTDTNNVDEVVIEIEGDTDYSDGIEYLVSSVDSSIYSSTGQTIPIGLDITVEDLGTSNTNYFTARESTNTSIYKKLVGDTLVGDQMLLVGYIVPNTTAGTAEGIDGSITIKAFFDKDLIGISDTYDGTESDSNGTTNEWTIGRTILTTTEWNTLRTNGVSFKIKVEANEGIWVNGSLEEIMKKTTVMDNIASTYVSSSLGINFGAISSDTNGKGVYTRAGTENDTYPIMYYRGAVEDNNVIFNDKCWKAVRTTDTGGVKLIYNGELSGLSAPLEESDYTILSNSGSMIFNPTENVWTLNATTEVGSYSTPLEIEFSVPNGYGYLLEIFGSSGSSISGSIYRGTSGTYMHNNGFGGGGGQPINAPETYFGTMGTDDSIKITFYGTGTSSQELILNVRVMHSDETLGMGCNNNFAASHITVNNTNKFEFNMNTNSPAYNGYMYGTAYTYTYGTVSGAYYDNSFIWDGTNYTLTDSATTTRNDNSHYSCGQTTKTATCTSLRYYYFNNYYITLTGGDGVEEAFINMNTNTNDSNAKNIIDIWYASEMSNVTNKLEDTIWCNDRSFGNNNNNGWIANGGSLSTQLYYGARERSNYASNTSTLKNQPSLLCANKNDAFTWKNTNGNTALDYPIGMLTEDEMVFAGGVAGTWNNDYYLMNNEKYWTLSPNFFTQHYASEFISNSSGSLYEDYVDSASGLRPAISIKRGQLITKGTGTVEDPYVIE